MSTYTQPTFMPVGTVLQTAIGQVFQTFSMLFRLMIVRWMIEGMLVGICLSLFLTAGSGSILSQILGDQHHTFSSYMVPFTSVNTVIFLLGIGLIALWYFIAASMIQIAVIFAVSRGEHHLSLAALFHLSWHRFIPFITSQVICAFLIVGGFFAFIFPGIGMLLFFTFVPYVILFEKKSGFAAIQRSITLIASHPLPLLGRIGLLWFIALSLNVFLTSNIFHSLGVLAHIGFILVLNMCLWWYSNAYMYLLYREAIFQSNTVKQKNKTISHIALSLCGWGIACFLLVGISGMLQTTELKKVFYVSPPSVKADKIPSLYEAPLKEL